MPSKVITEEPHQPLRKIVRLLLIGAGIAIGLEAVTSVSSAAKSRDHSYVANTVEASCTAGFSDSGQPAVTGPLVTGEARISCDTMPASLAFSAFIQTRATASAPWVKAGTPDTLPTLPSKIKTLVYLHPQAPCVEGADFRVAYDYAGVGTKGMHFSFPETYSPVRTVAKGECRRRP